jgi:hypothetical protein
MTSLKPLLLILTALAVAPGPSDADAIRLVEHQWLDAEYHADTATLMKLLLPEYHTVSERGIHSRDQLIAGVLKRGGHAVEPPYSTPTIEIHGNTALAIFTSGDSSYSVDVFAFENGGWHALHSQHTMFKKQP